MLLTVKIDEPEISKLVPQLENIISQIETGRKEGFGWEIIEEPEDKKLLCPKCNTEVDGLNVVLTGIECSRFLLYDGNPTYDKHEFEVDDDAAQLYNCPECGETLFINDEEAAIKFLKGE